MKIITVFLFTLLFVSAASFGKEIKKDFHKSFDVQKGYELRLEHGDGDVRITPWDKDVLDVQVRYRAESKSFGIGEDTEFNVEFDQREETIHIKGREKSHSHIGVYIKKRYEYVYEIKAPDYLNLDLRGEDGYVSIQGWKGKIEAMTDDGDIQLTDITNSWTELRTEDGDLEIDRMKGDDLYLKADDGDADIRDCNVGHAKISVEDGKVTIRHCNGNFDIKTDDGNILAQDLSTKILEVEAADGYVEMELTKGEEMDIDITTDDGDVILDIEKGTSAAISVNTDGGRIKMNLPDMERYEKDEHRASGEISGGNGNIHVSTVDGNILLREAR